MTSSYKSWKKLFLFCLGLFIAAAFCMKWMEGDFMSNGSLFTIIGLEVTYPKEQAIQVLSGLDEHVRTILRYHLHFDFVFMAGVYPGIAALCMMARYKVKAGWLKKLLLALAAFQLVAFACDITENMFLLKWVSNPAGVTQFGQYHLVVFLKWGLALFAALVSIPLQFKRTLGDTRAV